MGMWNYYRPREVIRCPFCDGIVSGWQGRSGQLNYFLYVEGHKYPFAVDLPYTDIMPFESSPQIPDAVLPIEFYIFGEYNQCESMWDAKCNTENDIWSKTVIITEHNLGDLVDDDDEHLEGMMWEINHNRQKYKDYLARLQEKLK
jgi:hypothetical protein